MVAGRVENFSTKFIPSEAEGLEEYSAVFLMAELLPFTLLLSSKSQPHIQYFLKQVLYGQLMVSAVEPKPWVPVGGILSPPLFLWRANVEILGKSASIYIPYIAAKQKHLFSIFGLKQKRPDIFREVFKV